jgi:hypothetical protein
MKTAAAIGMRNVVWFRARYVNYDDVHSDWHWDLFAQDYKRNRSQSLGTACHWQLLE